MWRPVLEGAWGLGLRFGPRLRVEALRGLPGSYWLLVAKRGKGSHSSSPVL